MVRLLIRYGGSVYEYVENGMVALDYLVRHMNVREFMNEAHIPMTQAMRDMVQSVNELFATEGRQNVEFQLPRDRERSREVRYPPDYVRLLVYNGFLPITEQLALIDHIVFMRYDYATLGFWNRNWFTIQGFRYSTLNGMIQDGLETTSSLMLLLFAPNRVYKGSKRPVNNMSMFELPTSHVIHEIPRSPEFIPVTRYAKGIRKGLFYDDPKKDYCGTFYYYEPESTTYLRASRVLHAKNKTAAAAILGVGDHVKEEGGMYPDKEHFMFAFRNHNLMFTPREFERLVATYSYARNVSKPYIDWYQLDRAQDRPYYCGHILELYAAEDYLDQAICIKGREAGYEVIVLERMVGGRQIVTEVLDTRSRDESLGNLYFLK